MVKLVNSARPCPVQHKCSIAEPFNQVSNGWPGSNQGTVTEMTALQRQELDAFVTTQLETKGTLYLSELTGQVIPVLRRISLLINTIQPDQSNPVFSLNFSSAGKGSFMDGKAKNIYFSKGGGGGGQWSEGHGPALTGKFFIPIF